MSDKERALEMEIEALRKQVVGLGGTPVGRRTVGGGGAQRKKGVAICSEQIIEEDYSPPIFPKVRFVYFSYPIEPAQLNSRYSRGCVLRGRRQGT